MTFARSTFARVLAGLMFLLALLVTQPTRAQEQNIRASLVVEGPVAPGGETTLAIRFSPVSPAWHGYWKNPGDAGLPMQLEWTLPEGVSVGEPRYPVPQTLVIDGLMNHIFEGDYAVLLPLRLDKSYAGGPVLQVGLEAFYLACTDEICVPQDATMQVNAPVGAGSAAPSADFTRWRSALAPLIDSPARFDMTAWLLRVAIPLPAGVDPGEPHVFIGNRDLVNYAQAQGFRRTGDWLVAEIPLALKGDRPGQVDGILRLGNGAGLRFVAEPGEVPSGGTRLMALADDVPPLWLLLGGALLGGLMLNVMPCVFPILSLKALSLARAGEGEHEARMEGLSYTAGVVLACLALGAVMLALRAAGEQVGWAFQLQEPAVVVALLALAVLITANLLGLFELPGLSISGGSTPRGAFATGLLAAFVATPCTGPFMAAALGAALLLPAPLAVLLFAALGVGLALPFLLLGFVPALRSRLPRPGPWMATFRKAMAIPMGLTALALVWLLWRMGGTTFALAALILAVTITVLLTILLGSKFAGHPARKLLALTMIANSIGVTLLAVNTFERTERAASASALESIPFTNADLSEVRASGSPVFVYFTADWCVTCKVNESVAIEREATREAFDKAGVVTLRGDWTLRQPEITAFLTERGVAGVPLYLWYEPGAAEPEQLPQVLTPDSLIELAQRPRQAPRPQE
ncbi:protein-disulfide reductase DsbD family protein [Parerythrobacter aestuarii]|uniref:protein-disulfide reductase DsbD family protein n=1 Tax=Parerythrobacter aestuarii TaxID=3020909 RepID=UPI0024DE30E7|nr:thioredoxin family protein [Parerythrobacter aestuarii]